MGRPPRRAVRLVLRAGRQSATASSPSRPRGMFGTCRFRFWIPSWWPAWGTHADIAGGRGGDARAIPIGRERCSSAQRSGKRRGIGNAGLKSMTVVPLGRLVLDFRRFRNYNPRGFPDVFRIHLPSPKRLRRRADLDRRTGCSPIVRTRRTRNGDPGAQGRR